MKNVSIVILLVLLSFSVLAQPSSSSVSSDNFKSYKTKLGIKAGYNWSYATANESGITLNGRNGYMVGMFLSAPHRSLLGYRTELIYSKQGYSFDDGGKNTEVLNDYIYLPQLTTFSIGKIFQLQLGGQIGFLLNSKRTEGGKDSSITGIMNRLDYGFAGGVELNPIAGLIVGGRYNLGLGKLYKQEQAGTATPYPLPFNPQTTNLKNGLFQFFIGYKF